jgi:hypothetical protein
MQTGYMAAALAPLARQWSELWVHRLDEENGEDELMELELVEFVASVAMSRMAQLEC